MSERVSMSRPWRRAAAAGLLAAGMLCWAPSGRAEYEDPGESAAPAETAAEKARQKQLLEKLDQVLERQQALDKRLDEVMEELRIIKLRTRLAR
jgi:hypothetical protein